MAVGRTTAALLAALALALAPAAAPARDAPRPLPADADELLVGFRDGTPAARRGAARRAAGVQAVRALRVDGVQLARTAPGTSRAEALTALRERPDVAFAQPNRVRTAAALPDDPLLSSLWGLHNLTTGPGVLGQPSTAGSDVDAPAAWELATGGDVLVAVVDEGIAYDHPDLAANMWTNPGEIAGNGVDDDGDGWVDDVHGADTLTGDGDPRDIGGHGTHVAGTIAAVGDNATGTVGIAWRAQLMAVRALGANGGTDATVAEAFDYAGDHGARIVNASLGGPGASPVMDAAMAAHPGTLFVVAAGNEAQDNDEPATASYPCASSAANLVCVAATDQRDELASFSNRGTQTVDLAAPGTAIRSTAPDREAAAPAWTFDAGTDGWTGTWVADAGALADAVGEYAPLSDGATWSPVLDVAGRGGCELSLALRADTWAGDDLTLSAEVDGVVHVLDSGDDLWTGGRFRTYAYDLPEGDALRVGARLQADALTQGEGIDLDDVVVTCAGPQDGPGTYTVMQGTSMATPHVTGAAVLALARRPGLTTSALRAALLRTGDLRPALATTTVTGRRLDAGALLRDPVVAPDPVASALTARDLDQTSARLTGTVDAQGGEVRWVVEHGPTTAYGTQTPTTAVAAGDGPQAVAVVLDDLAEGVAHHARLVALREDGRHPGPDLGFTPTAAPTTTTPEQPSEPTPTTTAPGTDTPPASTTPEAEPPRPDSTTAAPDPDPPPATTTPAAGPPAPTPPPATTTPTTGQPAPTAPAPDSPAATTTPAPDAPPATTTPTPGSPASDTATGPSPGPAPPPADRPTSSAPGSAAPAGVPAPALLLPVTPAPRTTRPPSLRAVLATTALRCTRRGRAVRCRPAGGVRLRATLMRRGRAVARATAGPSGALLLRPVRRPPAGVYVLHLRARDATGRTITVRRALRLR